MKRFIPVWLVSVLLFFLNIEVKCVSDTPRSRESFNRDWRFIKFLNSSTDNTDFDKEPADLHLPSYDDSKWRLLDLPHDWAIEGPFSDTLENNTGLLPWKGIGWYRKHFRIEENEKDEKLYIYFDGAMAYCEVWLNGKYVGGWPYGYTSFRLDIPVKDPALWNLEDPQLYRASVTVFQDDVISDICETSFGFRTLTFTARDGFLLNGKMTPVRGVCNHHDLGALGAAFNTRAAERQLEILREMGCNAIRTSHNPPAPELLDLCDRMCFLVEDEAFDTWKTPKKQNDYNKLFYSWHKEDLKAMVRRDRNHPSVFIWSTGNEVNDQNNPALSESLRQIIKSEDNTRPVTVGCNWDESGTNGFQKSVDVFGINYRLYRYNSFSRV